MMQVDKEEEKKQRRREKDEERKRKKLASETPASETPVKHQRRGPAG